MDSPDESGYVLQNLREAAEHLEKAADALRAGDTSRFETWIPWIYRKLNAAWNSRDLSTAEQLDTSTYEERCRFPRELESNVTDSPPTTDH